MVGDGFRISVVMVVATLMLRGPSFSQDLTAEELLNKGLQTYSQGDFEGSRDAYTQFLDSFGASDEARQAVERVRPLLALSLVRLGQFVEAREAIETAQAGSNLRPEIAEELMFWRGVCEFDAAEYTLARVTFREFSEQFPRSPKRQEALILLGTAFVLDGKHAEAAEFFSKLHRALNGFDRGRAVILELHSLLTDKQLDTARDLALTEYRQMDEILQIVAFQTQMLNLGTQFLEAERYTDAVACLQLIWPRERLVSHQKTRLKLLEDRLTAAKERKEDAYRQIQLGEMIAKVKRELENFQEIGSFDAAVRMRLARAFQRMPRYREAALVMEAMLEELPPDALVEQASVNLVQCWMQTGNWQRAVSAARRFAETFPDSTELPLVLFMKGQAEQNDQTYTESVETFDGIAKTHVESEIAPRALFMAGFGELLREDYAAALERFESIPVNYPESTILETALYWKGMAFSLAKKHARSREIMQTYLDQYGEDGRYAGAANFRRAYSAQSLKDYATSIPELEAFLLKYPGHPQQNEALLLLGNALVTNGFLDEGISRYTQISPEDTKLFEEGWFKVGKALRLQEKSAELRAHMEKFREEHPRSPRVAEAVYWIGWTHLQKGESDKARDIYWTTIDELGDDPMAHSVTDLFKGLLRLYNSDEGRVALQWRMTQVLEKANAENRETLATRTLWAQAKRLENESPTRANLLYLAGAGRVDAETASPMLLADFADALRLAGEPERASKMYRDLLKWNPRALEKDRAFAGLGLIAVAAGKPEKALEYFERFERETTGSPLYGEILLAKADLLSAKGRDTEAETVLNRLLESDSVGSRDKARALLTLGEIQMTQNRPEKAIPYFQRLYVLYGRWIEYVAPAYLRSAEAFEMLGDRESAIRTYEEVLASEALSATSEAETARSRLKSLKPSGTKEDAG